MIDFVKYLENFYKVWIEGLFYVLLKCVFRVEYQDIVRKGVQKCLVAIVSNLEDLKIR